MKKIKIINVILEWTTMIASGWMILTWYDWKLLVILIIYGWYLNLMRVKI